MRNGMRVQAECSDHAADDRTGTCPARARKARRRVETGTGQRSGAEILRWSGPESNAGEDLLCLTETEFYAGRKEIVAKRESTGRGRGGSEACLPGSGKEREEYRFPGDGTGGNGMESGSAPCYAPGRDVVAVPVVDGKRLDAHTCSGLGAVHEVVLTDIDAGVVAGAGNSEHHNVARAQAVAGNAPAYAGLIAADAGHGNAVLGTGPVHESGAVESAGGGGAAGNIGAAELALGRGGYGCTAAGGNVHRLSVAGSVGLLAAARSHEKGHAQKQQRKIPIQGMSAKSRHDGPAGVEKYNISLLWYPPKSCKF